MLAFAHSKNLSTSNPRRGGHVTLAFKEAQMWIVERSDSSHRSTWATGHDAKHYIRCLGMVSPISPYMFDVCLSSGDHIVASMIRR